MGQREVLAVLAFSVLCSVHQRDSDRKASVKGSILVLTLACRFITRYTNSTNVKFKCHPMKCCRIYYTLPYCDFISNQLELACCNAMPVLVTPGWTSDHSEGGLMYRSIPKPPMPPPRANPRAFDFFEKFWSNSPLCCQFRRSNAPPSRRVKANCGNKFCKIFNHYEFVQLVFASYFKQRHIPR